ncbi:323_t:CDS:2, partial [Entrophospora sp. SA101]
MAGNRRARRSRMDAQYFDEFRTHFWKRPEDEFDKIRNINSSNRRQRRIWGNNTPAPSTGEVEHELGQTLPDNRRSRRTSVDSRRSRRRSASPSPPRDAINTNTNNPGVENPEQNIGHSGSIESSSLQPPPYEAIDEAQNNSSEMNQSHVVSNREVAVSGNIPLSQNDSDLQDVEVSEVRSFSSQDAMSIDGSLENYSRQKTNTLENDPSHLDTIAEDPSDDNRSQNKESDIPETSTTNSVNFLELYNKITYAEENNQKTTQDVIRCYYNFGKGLTIWFDHYRQSNNEDASNALVNDKIREQTVDKITEVNLRKRKEKARKIYKLFNSVGVELIGRVRSFSASAISKLSLDDIDYIIAKTLKANRNLAENEYKDFMEPVERMERLTPHRIRDEIRDKVSYTDNIEKQLQESEERVQNLRHRFKVISSRRSSPSLYNSEEEDTDMAHIDPFINITRGLNRLENHFTGGTPLINPANIIQ